MNLHVGPSTEFPRWVYALLFVALWVMLICSVVVVSSRIDDLSIWKVILYTGLFGVYLIAENRAHQAAEQVGERTHEGLRYLLSLTWWLLMLGSPLAYALWPQEQVSVSVAGALLALAGVGVRVSSVRQLGRFFSGHIESWENQQVVESGFYRYIRHPGYLGSILQTIGMPLVVNAYLILPLAGVVIVLFVRRLQWEEQHLARTLPGYQAYMGRTHRLIPGVW